MAKMTDSELTSLVDSMLSESLRLSGSEAGGGGRRERAIEYLNGEMKDLPAAEGESSVVSRDVADAIGWILPGLSRVFLGSEKIVQYEPENPNDVEAAKQATDYVNFKLLRDIDGHKVLYTAMFDALHMGNGVLKHYWSRRPEYRTVRYSGLDERAIAYLAQDEDVEIVEQVEHEGEFYPPPVDPQTGQPGVAPKLFDVKIRRLAKKGQLCLEVIPDEDFIIEPSARSLDERECRFAAHRTRPTRTELIERGFKKSIVAELDAVQESYTEDVRRETGDLTGRAYSADPYDHAPAERVEVYECYMLVDYDGDGLAEWRQVIVAGGNNGASSKVILSNEDYDGLPFSDLVPDPIPHVWRGRSIYDLVQEQQKIKTVLLRQMLNNLYRTVTPERFADISRIDNPDQLYNRTPGNVIITKGPPGDIVMDTTIPFVAKEVFPALEYIDKITEKRTGLSEQGQGLDPEALQNQTAAAVQAQQSALHLKREDYARNIANGLRRVFKKCLALIVENQDAPCMIRLRDKFVPIDPRSWNAHMDCVVNTGLGSGSRDRDMQILQQVLIKQENIISQIGPDNPLVPMEKYRATLAKYIEAAGLRDADLYFGEVSPEQAQKMAADIAQKMDGGKAQAEQAKMQIEQAKMQADMQMMQAKAQMDVQKAQMEAQLEAGRMEKQLQIENMQAQADIQVNNQKAQAELVLKEREFEFKKELEYLKLYLSASQGAMAARGGPEEAGSQRLSLDQLKQMMASGGGAITPEMIEQAATPPPTPLESTVRDLQDALGQMAQFMAQNTQEMNARMEQVTAMIAAPTVLERDPVTGRAIAARKVLQ